MNKKIIAATLLTIITALSLSAVHAKQQRKGPPGGKPPAEAFAACASASEKDSCSYSGDRGEATGICKGPPQGEGELACVPEGGRPSRN